MNLSLETSSRGWSQQLQQPHEKGRLGQLGRPWSFCSCCCSRSSRAHPAVTAQLPFIHALDICFNVVNNNLLQSFIQMWLSNNIKLVKKTAASCLFPEN